MDISTIIRGKVLAALSTLKYKTVAIPIFDEVVNPSAVIPIVDKAEIYVLIQDQQHFDNANQNICEVRKSCNLTIRVVTKWGLVGSKKVCEDIGDSIESLLRTKRGGSLLAGVQKVELEMSRTQTEISNSNLAFSKILIFNFIINI